MVRGGIVVSPVSVVVMYCFEFWISVGRFLEQLGNGISSFPLSFLEGIPWQLLLSSVVEFPLIGEVWLATVVFEVS